MAGAYTYKQLEQLWLSAGGSPRIAPLMAAIAMAESGGNPNAENPSGATGLWQILGAVHSADQSRLKDPQVNAREAVAKYNTQGLGAWTTYTSGAYRKFIQGGGKGVITGSQFVQEAEKFTGDPYVWGGTSPKGFDCSGLVQYALQKMGLKNVPRTSEAQYAWVQHISKSQLKPGDLVFYAGSDGTDSAPGHVAIYAGGGQIIQALETGTNIGKFPIDSAGTPVGYGRVPGIFGSGSGTFNPAGGSGSGGQNITLTSWNPGPPLPAVGFPLPALDDVFGLITNTTKLSGVAGPLAKISNTLTEVEHYIEWFFVPNHWVRLFTGVLGGGLVLTGIVTMTRTGHGYSVNVPQVGSVPAPGGQIAPALGIAEVTAGAILLFVAFHNLEAEGVKDWPSLLHYFQQKLQSGGKQAE